MEKQINLNLNVNDKFFRQLEKYLIEEANLGGYDINPVIEKVVVGTLKTLKDLSKQQGNKDLNNIVISFKDEEFINPDFYTDMENHIDTELNQNIHSTTLERVVDSIVEFMNNYSDIQIKAQKIKIPELINSNKELEAMTKYVTNNWDGFEKVDPQDFFYKIWESCLDKTKKIFDIYKFSDFIEQWNTERKDYKNWKKAGTQMTKEDFNNQISNDVIQELPFLIMFKIMSLSSELNKNWDYEKVAESITKKIKSDFPEACNLKPKGWSKLEEIYDDYEGMSEFDSAKAKKEFGGMNSGIGGHSFEVRVALPYVMYDDVNQNRKPLEVLVQAMLTHAYVLNEKNNASEMLRELVELKEKYDQPEYYQNTVKEIEFDFKVALNKELFIMINDSNPNILKNCSFIKTPEYFAEKRAKKLEKKIKP